MSKHVAAILVAAGATLVSAAAAQEKPGEAVDVYDAFNRFCIEHFGAEKEPLIYEKFGKDLKILDDGSWRHVSENSACIAWETNLPAKTHVEYGETAAYGRRTPEPERHFYIQVHYLKDLETNKTYHYRLVSVDERGNRIVSPDQTLETRKTEGALYIPGDVEGPPYILKDPDRSYVLKEDITVPGVGIAIMAAGVTVDLNGHTLTYNDSPGVTFTHAKGTQIDEKLIDPKHIVNLVTYSDKPMGWMPMVYGIGAGTHGGGPKVDRLKVLNGVIRQGAGNGCADASGHGMNPVFFYGNAASEVAGLTVDYSGPQVAGIQLFWSQKPDVHHNVVLDRGTVVTNRHMMCCAITHPGNWNLVKRCRQTAMTDGKAADVEMHNNEVYLDSCCTNSMGFYLRGEGGRMHDNRILGTGYMPEAAATSPSRIKFYDNLIQMQADKPSDRYFDEYGPQGKIIGFRFTWSGVQNEIFNNLMVFHAKRGGTIRGVQISGMKTIKDNLFHDNIIKAIADDEESGKVVYDGTRNYNVTTNGGAIVINGNSIPEVGRNFFRNNRVISNFCNVSFGDNYGIGVNQSFLGNTFVREGTRKDYATFRFMTWQDREVKGHEFVDSAFENGAGYDRVQYYGENRMGFSIGHTLTVSTVPGAVVTIKDKTGSTVFTGEAAAEGKVSLALMEYLQEKAGRTDLTPHTITVEKDGKAAVRTVTVDRKQEVEIKP